MPGDHIRFRITFAKTEAMRYTGHLDLHRTWERTFRRAKLPLSYRHGFNPQPRINLACALPLGITSQCELMDAWLETPVTINDLQQRLPPALPPGLEILEIQEIEQSEPALQTQVLSSEYRISLAPPVQDLAQRCAQLLASPAIIRQWKGKEYDLRPLVLQLDCLPGTVDGLQAIAVVMRAQEGATGRPEEVVGALGISPTSTRILRTKIELAAG